MTVAFSRNGWDIAQPEAQCYTPIVLVTRRWSRGWPLVAARAVHARLDRSRGSAVRPACWRIRNRDQPSGLLHWSGPRSSLPPGPRCLRRAPCQPPPLAADERQEPLVPAGDDRADGDGEAGAAGVSEKQARAVVEDVAATVAAEAVADW